jgi:hypothetical protein
MKKEKESEEKDLETLRREFRNMEVNRKTLAEESNSVSFAERVKSRKTAYSRAHAHL